METGGSSEDEEGGWKKETTMNSNKKTVDKEKRKKKKKSHESDKENKAKKEKKKATKEDKGKEESTKKKGTGSKSKAKKQKNGDIVQLENNEAPEALTNKPLKAKQSDENSLPSSPTIDAKVSKKKKKEKSEREKSKLKKKESRHSAVEEDSLPSADKSLSNKKKGKHHSSHSKSTLKSKKSKKKDKKKDKKENKEKGQEQHVLKDDENGFKYNTELPTNNYQEEEFGSVGAIPTELFIEESLDPFGKNKSKKEDRQSVSRNGATTEQETETARDDLIPEWIQTNRKMRMSTKVAIVVSILVFVMIILLVYFAVFHNSGGHLTGGKNDQLPPSGSNSRPQPSMAPSLRSPSLR